MSDNPRIEELRRRVQKDPASIAFAQLAEEYRRSGEHEEAVRVCRTGLAKHPSYLSARVTLGRALIELEQYDEARTELDYVLRSAPENLAAIRGLAEIYQRRGELGEALKQYQTALGIAQHDPELEETVQELTRQLGGTAHAPTESQGSESPLARTRVQASQRTVPPPIPGAESQPEPSDAHVASIEVPPALQTFQPAKGASATPLSPELEAAADEFTRALEALDAITIDLPTPPISAGSFDLPPIPAGEDDRLVPAIDWEHTGFDAPSLADDPTPADEAAIPEPLVAAAPSGDATSGPDADAVADLQNWLDNIVLDRQR